MQQHPVPQPITSYEFRLVGDMTLKQFFKLAAGLVLAFIIYTINPPGFIKWPLIFLFSLTGAAMAFVPFEGRPIDVWIIAFFKRIYSPTQYIWRQKGKIITPASPVIPPPSLSPPPPTTEMPVLFKAGPTAPAPLPPKIVPSSPPRVRGKTVEATYTPHVIIPATPSMPNLLTGFVHDRDNRIVENAILEIRNADGIPVRAFKTNKLGQFQSATPLPNGIFEIETEKEGYQFDIIKIELKGSIVPPIEIISK